jgi:GGDEF domain-containing protein
LQSINARFGNEVGDTVLKALADRMRKEFHAGDLLFRWNGPTLVALLPREETIDEMRRTVKRTFEVPFEMDFYLRGRQIMLPVAAAWSVVRIIPPASTVFGYIERFVATQSPRDYC